MFDKNNYREELTSIFPDMSESDIEERVSFMAEKYKTVKKGDNVIHLNYYGGLSETEIQEIEALLDDVGYELSRFDKSRIPQNNGLEEFTLHIALAIGVDTMRTIIQGTASSALWDAIKLSALIVWRKTKVKTLKRITSQGVTELETNFGISTALDGERQFNFKIGGNLSEEGALKAMDKALEFLKEVEPEKTGKAFPNFTIINPETGKYEIVDVEKELLRKNQDQEE